MDLLRKTFWFLLFIFATLCFVVLFEKGTDHFTSNVQKQVQEFKDYVGKTVQEQLHPKKEPKK